MKIGKYDITFFQAEDHYDKHGNKAVDYDREIYRTNLRFLLAGLLDGSIKNWWFKFYIWPKPFGKKRR